MRQTFAAIVSAGMLAAAPAFAQDTPSASPDSPEPAAAAADAWLPSLMTETPAEGFALALTMARKAVTTTQTDVETLHKLRPAYAHDPDSLIDVSGVVAAYFATVAAANDYWRD